MPRPRNLMSTKQANLALARLHSKTPEEMANLALAMLDIRQVVELVKDLKINKSMKLTILKNTFYVYRNEDNSLTICTSEEVVDMSEGTKGLIVPDKYIKKAIRILWHELNLK